MKLPVSLLTSCRIATAGILTRSLQACLQAQGLGHLALGSWSTLLMT